MDGPRGSAGVQACGWACRRVGVRMRMAVNKKGKTKEEKEKNTDWWVLDVWTCGCVGVRMGVQPCGHADVDGCKEKRKKKKKTLTGCFERADGRVGVWACGHVGVRMGVRKRITVKKEKRKKRKEKRKKRKEKRKKRKEKRKTYWSGHVDVLRMGVCALAGGCGWL